MQDNIPPKPPKSYRIILDLPRAEKRLDGALLLAIRSIKDNLDLKNVSRTAFKTMFNEGKIQIKGQKARPSSAVAKGITYVDILL
jgi:ribosomal 50S subunit-recycling heat shock protein